MNWIYNICSCITPQLKISLVDYLNSTYLNQQIIQQQKISQQDHQPQCDLTQHVYLRAKKQSYNFMKISTSCDDQQHIQSQANEKDNLQNSISNDQILDVFWYPPLNSPNKWQHYANIYTTKHKILTTILQEPPTSSNYDKVYDSQDQLKLSIYCRQQLLIKGKKINSYRFTFDLFNSTLQQYQQSLNNIDIKQIYHLIDTTQDLQTNPNDETFSIKYFLLKKLLVINPHELIIAQKIQNKINEQSLKQKIITIFSVDQNYHPNKQSNQNKAWLHLCGLVITQIDHNLHFQGYINLQLNVSVSPSMLKQPFSKQIRIFVQKLVCTIRKSDGI